MRFTLLMSSSRHSMVRSEPRIYSRSGFYTSTGALADSNDGRSVGVPCAMWVSTLN